MIEERSKADLRPDQTGTLAAMTLGELWQQATQAGVEPTWLGGRGVTAEWLGRPVGAVVCDSRRVVAADVFVAVGGSQHDGAHYIGDAIRRGAVGIVLGRDVPPPSGLDGVAVWQVANPRAALAVLAQARHGWPGRGLCLVGITGTKGKTTTAYLVRSVLQTAGVATGLLGTVVYDVLDGVNRPAPLTTPDAPELAARLADLRRAGGQAAVMEVSSIALDQHRVGGLDFTAGVFTNLSGDHLDYHGTMEAYLEAKGRLFTGLYGCSAAVLNAESEAAVRLARRTTGRVVWYACDGPADVYARAISSDARGSRFELCIAGRRDVVRTVLVGRHNVANCLAAAATGMGLGIDAATVAEGLRRAPAVPGRLESVNAGQPFAVLVDYAHTDDSLAKVLDAVRPLARGRVIVVFGCGGDRDRTKRPRMAEAAAAGSDVVVVTSDNPRTERPEAIIAEILTGFSATQRRAVIVEADRRLAIGLALREARAGDVVLIAGKGHEDYQIVGAAKLPFDDRQVARQWLTTLGFGSGSEAPWAAAAGA